MIWIFWAIFGAAVIHVAEEYKYSGGFLDVLKGFDQRYTPFITVNFAIITNTLFLLLCLAGALVGNRSPIFSLSVASVLFVNAWVHIIRTIRAMRYVSGVISGTFLYLPLSIYAYFLFSVSGRLSLPEMLVSLVLGVLYQAMPIFYLMLSGR